tara:strand:- start:24006 stop:24191 length:186 start_codon:yes stop_codon:yes gene_type:complete
MDNGVEKERIKHINFTMNEIHDSNNTIYEMLMDRDNISLKTEVVANIKRLRSILENIEDEI